MLKILLIGHFIGDYYLQFNIIQKNKSKWLWLVLHSLIYAFIMTLCFSIYQHSWWIIVLFTIFFASHLLVDKSKYLLEKHFYKSNHKIGLMIYIVDQLIHIAIVVGVTWFFSKNNLNNFGKWIYCITRYFKIKNFAGIVLATVIIFLPTSTFIVKLFDDLPKSKNEDKEVLMISTDTLKCNDSVMVTNSVQTADIKTGKIIGYLERFIILIFFIAELHGLIGLVLTAKSLARFKQFEDKYFAEKFLIGTLLSLVITILTIMMCEI
ncbi:MAG: DUF3307 domain-containing protein [Erysipelotrichales bacterium]|nr:DUF3307 domain-containing protein [Erysipelotrichales bacterium]